MRLDKPWRALSTAEVATLGGQTGVFELGDDGGATVLIGYAGGHSLFGLRGELARHLEGGTASRFRCEVTTAYLSRYRELLMVHLHDHGRLPPDNQEDVGRLGRLDPA